MATADDLFLAERPRLIGLAYRLLGSISDAEDVVQESWMRWSRVDPSTVDRPAAWLTTTVSRLGLDRLRARRRDRLEYVGPWLPEPIVRPMQLDDPSQIVELSDSLTTAFLVLLERLSPDERLVVLLVDVFGEPFATVSRMLGRSDDACRQLAVRARRKLGDAAGHEPHRPARPEQMAIAAAFVGAVMEGDVAAVTAMLTDDAVLTSDGGPHRHAARRPVRGPDRIARFLVNLARRLPHSTTFDPVWVNGSPGALVRIAERPFMVSLVELDGDRVCRQYSVLNPDKLAAVHRTIELI